MDSEYLVRRLEDSCSTSFGSFRSVRMPYYGIFSQYLNGLSAFLVAQFRSELFSKTELLENFVN